MILFLKYGILRSFFGKLRIRAVLRVSAIRVNSLPDVAAAGQWHMPAPGITWQKIHNAGNKKLTKERGNTMKKVKDARKPKFRKVSELTNEELTDPDFRKKQLEILNNGKPEITCSKCHHCR